MISDSVCILHLTDIHAGPGELVDEDGKVSIKGAERMKQLPRLSNYISALARKPDYVIISGDIAIKGRKEGMETFRDWLLQHVKLGHLPPTKQILIVPGNHDVARQIRIDQTSTGRFRDFWNAFGTTFPHAHIPDIDPSLDPAPQINLAARQPIGGIKATTKNGRSVIKSSYPFVLDLQRDVLIFLFNSAHACGIPLPPDKNILDPIDAFIGSQPSGSASSLHKAREAYLDSLIIDAGLITDPQLTYFSQLMQHMRKKLGGRFEQITKIAVLHHHVTHLWKQQLELKNFESTVDASHLKQALIENSFDIVLHGHKHTNHVGIDGALIPVSEATKFNPLCIVSGGTVGGHPRVGDFQTFKIIDLHGQQGPRTKAVISEVPIRETANPANAIRDESKIFHAPISQKLPLLHDINSVKNALDEYVLKRCSPELDDNVGVRGKETSEKTYNSQLFSPALRYRCHSFVDDGTKKTFYEVILATEKIGFRTLSRIHWLVTDVLGAKQSNNRVVLVIGNLQDTHYSEATSPNEIEESINMLRKDLAPAIDSARLELRDYKVSQAEIIEASRASK